LALRLSETPKAEEAIATIRMAIGHKGDLAQDAGCKSKWLQSTGLGCLVTDWGSAFYAEETRRVVLAMGATFDHPAAGMAQLRGTVERMFRTMDTRLMGYFSGRTFSNAVEKGDYDAKAMASVPLDVLVQALVRSVVDDYHHRPHAGLGGETPYNAWLRVMKSTGRIPTPDKHRQRGIFGIETTCTLDNGGIEILGLRYQNREIYDFFTHRGVTDVTVRVDPADMGWASVLLDDDWVTVPCLKREFRGVTLKVWKDA